MGICIALSFAHNDCTIPDELHEYDADLDLPVTDSANPSISRAPSVFDR